MKERFYITAAIPYVNAAPHIGHALEFVQGDAIARYERLLGKDAKYISGADENSLKNVQAAEKEGITTEELCARNAKKFEELGSALGVHFDNFLRSSSKEHHLSSQELWKRCLARGDIYKKKYKGLYCVGCEAFYTREELNEVGECFEHPGRPLEEIEEENYFFKLSKYQEQIEGLIAADTYRVVPESRKNEALGFIRQGLEDFSISRSVERARGWGVPVPHDDSQIMYVWFDALNVYRDAAPDFWPADVHLIGKGILRFHAVYWPAILRSADLPLPRNLFVHGYLTVDGQKMSKTLGNVVDPIAIIQKYGADAVRYYLLKEIPSTADGDFSEEKLKTLYNADLANGLGNLVARVATLGESIGEIEIKNTAFAFPPSFEKHFKEFTMHEALQELWTQVRATDKYINDTKPWEKNGEELKTIIVHASEAILSVAHSLEPFLPQTVKKIREQFTLNENILRIKKDASLFPRL